MTGDNGLRDAVAQALAEVAEDFCFDADATGYMDPSEALR